MSEKCGRYLTPPAVGRMLGVEAAKVISWVRSGELRAMNLAERRTSKRKRYRISREALDAFLLSREVTPLAPAPTRRRKDEGVIEFY